MAASSASRSWARRALTTSAVAAMGLLALAIPASAHTPDAKAGCDKKTNTPIVTVNLVAYDIKPDNATPNTVKIFVDGADKAAVEQAFGANLLNKTFTFDKLDGTVEHTFKIEVRAWNDKDVDKAPFWSQDFDRKSGICDKTPPTKPTKPTSPPSSSSSAPAPVPQPGVPPAQPPATGGLADTGASIGIPLAIGALLLVGGGVLLLVMRKRGQA